VAGTDRGQQTIEFLAAARPMLEELTRAGVDVADFGLFTSLRPVSFDFGRAAPILVKWLPRMDSPAVVESIARSLRGEPQAAGEGARQLIAAYRRMSDDESGARWAIADALSTLAGPADADDVITLLRDPSSGVARQMLCDALTRTRDPRAPDVLIELLDDDSVNGHAILALRRLGRWRTVPFPERSQPKLMAVLDRPAASDFAKSQARKALATLQRPRPKRA
jgi:HEAT repeat protein